jgi:hypothetical protein
MAQDGSLLGVYHVDLLERPPRDGASFLPFWAATHFAFPEGNYCTYTSILRECFPKEGSPPHQIAHPHLGFMFNFMKRGYVSALIPQVSSYFRRHGGQRQQHLRPIEEPAAARYRKDVTALCWGIVSGRARHVFRDPQGRALGEIDGKARVRLFVDAVMIRLSRAKLLRYPPIHVLRQVVRIVTGMILSKPYDRTDWQRIP